MNFCGANKKTHLYVCASGFYNNKYLCIGPRKIDDELFMDRGAGFRAEPASRRPCSKRRIK